MPKVKGKHPFNTGNDFINLAKNRGANTNEKGIFTKITTRNGSTFVKPGNEPLDKRTVANLKRWFRLLGLMALFGISTITYLLVTHQLFIVW